MERLTTERSWEDAKKDLSNEMGYSHIWKRLNEIENIFGKEYDIDRLREMIEADRDGRCVVLPVKPGGIVRFARNPRAKQEKVDAITIYADGRITYSFHEVGMKTQWVDEWSEVESEDYAPVEPSEESEAALKGEQDESVL